MLIFGLLQLASALDLSCNDNVVMYWGQNSYGGSHLDQPELWEKDLEYYCRQDDVDIIAISFLNAFRAGSGQLPEINFASHCETSFDNYPSLHDCPKIRADIKFCQSQGKTILLSLGGAIANTNLPSPAAAEEFADTLWNMFMGGKHLYRPFGDAIVDGIDLDLEGGSQDNYDKFLATLQNHYSRSYRKYYVTAAPQCEFPDRNLHRIMETSHIDAIFIQFYNNFCGVQNYNNPWAWNWPQWATWAATKSHNNKVKLFLGVPASRTAAGTGYVELGKLEGIVDDLRKTYPVFGGIMLWDASQSENNLVQGKPFSRHTKDRLLAGGNCNNPPTHTSTTTTSTTTKPTSSCPTSEPCTTATTATRPSTTTTKPTSSCPTSEPCTTATTTTTRTSTTTTNPTNSCPTSEPCSTTTKPISSCPTSGEPCSGTTTTTVSTTITVTYTSPPTPKPTNSCPTLGDPCLGGTACSGPNYAVCDHGRWLVYPCGSGTTCTLDAANNAYCDFPGINPPPPCSSQLQLGSTYNTILL